MKNSLLLFLIFIVGLTLTATSRSDDSDPTVVEHVDLQKYSGLWYEIAHSKNFFQRNCLRSTAEYQVIDPTTISVHNVCYKEDHEISDISGKARITDPATPAKLRVRFNFFARGDYWIVDLDTNYQWAVVSGPRKKSLFILSRTPVWEKGFQEQFLNRLKSRGFNLDNLVFDRGDLVSKQ